MKKVLLNTVSGVRPSLCQLSFQGILPPALYKPVWLRNRYA